MATCPAPWPVFHSTPLPNILFLLASQYPDMTYAEWPRNLYNISEGYRKFTYSDLANAVNASAWWIEENVGKLEDGKKDGKETLVYFGPNDIRYAVLFFASIIAGYKMLYPSPRYGAEALIKLIEAAGAKTMLTPETPLPVVTEILQKKEMKQYQIPSLEQCFAKKAEKYPFTKTFEECKDEALLCLHTSGTTGFPKPILYTHDWVSSFSRSAHLGATPGFNRSTDVLNGAWPGKRVFVIAPPFHASGATVMLFYPLLVGQTPIYPPPQTTLEEAVDGTLAALDVLHASHQKNVANGNSVHNQGKVVDMVLMGPPHIEHLAKDAHKMAKMSERATALAYGGGSVARTAGDAIAQRMNLFNVFASTEMGVWPLLYQLRTTTTGQQGIPGSEDGKWEYYDVHPAFNINFDPVFTDSSGRTVFEAVAKRNDGQEWDGYIQPLFKIYKNVSEKRVSDLFVQHPTNSTLYKYHGRADDLLVFITNEKFFPTAAEQRIAALPGVAEALLVGMRRPKAALLLRLVDGKAVDDKLWEGIEAVNKDSPVYARVERDMILLVKEPFLKTAKESVRRNNMLKLYERELDVLYEQGPRDCRRGLL
ncbi:acetyl-CoA synthetase-like protein [Stemphylium lycopersici]|nr:acetyl-CoA synthetase-like protein [Stemphylium lycopersici]